MLVSAATAYRFLYRFGLELNFVSLKELKINFFSLRFNVDSSSWSKQLPSVIVFENGKETNRKPFISPKGTVVRYRFTKVCSFMIMIKFQYIWYLHGKYLPNF